MRIFYSIIIVVLFFVNLAQADDSDNAADLGAIVVQASRSDDTAGNMNKDVTIITSQDIANSPAKNLPDLLNTVPGVDARVNSNIKDQQIDMGQFGESSGSNMVVLVDGRRLNTPDLANPDLSTIDLNSIDHIEIIQGSGTVLYGDNADGGVINIVLKKGQVNTKPSVTLTSEVDSYKGNKDGMDISGGLSQLTYQLDYDRQQSDNYRTYSNYWADDYDTRLNYNPTDILGVDFAQGYHLDRYRLPGGISLGNYFSSLYGTTIQGIDSVGPTGVSPFAISNNISSDSYFDVTPHMKFDAGNSNVDLSLFTSARKNEFNSVYPNGNALNSSDSTNYEEESYEFQPKLILSTPLRDNLDNKLTAGYDYIYYTEKRRFNSDGSPEDIVFADETSQSIYLLDELTMDERWLLNAGARGAWTDYVFNETEQTPIKLDRSPTTEGYDGGLGYKYNPDSKIFVDYNHSYRLPLLDEFFQDPFPGFNDAALNSGLTYQVGNQYQLGIKDQSFNGVHLGGAVTEVEYKNEIYFNPDTFVNSNYDGRTRHYSEEADAAVDLFNKKVQPFVNVTFQQAEFVKGDFSGNQIPLVPDHLANAGITFKPLDGLSTSFTTHFVGKEFLISDQANTQPKLKRYDTVDWNIKYDYKNMEVWLTLQNLFNSRYYTYGVAGSSADAYYPAPGRNAAAGIKVKF